MNDFSETLFDQQLRPEVIIHLGTMTANDGLPDVVKNAFENSSETICKLLDLPEYDQDEEDEFFDNLHRTLYHKKKLNYLCNFATPIPTKFSPDSSGYTSYGFGYYTNEWFYGETYEDCIKQALKWQKEFIDSERKSKTT